ncbi:hypothetical protein [Clostridium sp.]|uniref:hypothetical protein n=1 Tax=Clostridium sp. TaxID=1506 RepID=UPI00261E630C|nr:hypothetical protein [Clostridium sp.]
MARMKEENRKTYGVKKMWCSVLVVPRSTYYSKINPKNQIEKLRMKSLKLLY